MLYSMHHRERIKEFLNHYLTHSGINNATIISISSLLHLKGKIFHENIGFTWAEFYYYVASLFVKKESVTSRIACSAAIELLVLATDILDDLADEDNHGDILTKLSYPQAVSLSSILLMESLHIISEYKDSHSLQTVVHQLRVAAHGQADDLSLTISRDQIPTEQEYFAHVDRKSVSLTRLVFHLNVPIKEIVFWNQIATYIGYSGQISNDARDVFDDTKNDLRDRKATLPIIKALEASQTKDDGWLLTELTSVDLTDNHHKLMTVREYIKKTGAIKYCEILAEVYLNKSIQLLKQCQETSIHKEAYSNLITFLGDGEN
jgi:competence protein ComQ